MDKKKLAALSMLIIPWLSVPFLGRKAFFRFFPSASLINLLIILLSVIANKRRWWINKNPLFRKLPIDFSYILGPHLVATLWIFKLTYGSFPIYLITNIVLDWINAFPFAGLWKKIGFFKFKKMSPSIYWWLNVLMGIVIYGYQYVVEKMIRKKNKTLLN